MTPEEFWGILHSMPEPQPVFWRLYYDETGFPLFYTQEDKQGNYIDVTPEQYQRASMRVRVRNGQLIELNTNPIKKKVPAETGTPCHPNDVSIVVPTEGPHQYWRIETHESN